MRRDYLFNEGWEFIKTGTDVDIDVAMKNTLWAPVDIPHDWLIYDANNMYEDSQGIYRKSFTYIPQKDTCVFIKFEGVYMEPSVYVNGSFAGEWKYGYNTFEIDITNLLREGDNQIVVRVFHRNPNSRWYSGAGIYRDIWIKERPCTHLVTDGTYVRTIKTATGVGIKVSSEATDNSLSIGYRIIQDGGLVVAEANASVGEDCIIDIPDAIMWDINNPYRYSLETNLISSGKIIDSETINIGLRFISVDADKGLFLNGEHLKIQGVCLHHDLGALGAAFNAQAARRQLVLMKRMGVNAIRTSHNMPAPALVELCDELGLLLDDEMFDMWRLPKREYDYARFFDEWVSRDVAYFVRRDRNHPSVFMWSVGNEIYDTHAEPEKGYDTAKLLYDEVKLHDPDMNGRVTFASNFLEGESTQRCGDIFDMVGYNYGERLYEAHHKSHPAWSIYGSETGSTLQSRGIYHFPYSEAILTDYDEQCSSLGNSTCSWGAPNSEFCITTERDTEYSAGQFLWAGIDYIGEPTPYSTKNSYFGQADTACFPKDSYYMYQAAWTDYRVAPMVHIFPYWDFNEGQQIDVRVVSNAPAVELFFNGQSLGRCELDHMNGKKLSADYNLTYTSGKLEAIAYDEHGQAIARDVKESFGDAARLAIKAERTEGLADGRDMFFLEINAYDCDGKLVENANNRVRIRVDGPARLVGLDNGDSTDYDSYKIDSRRMFVGKLLAMIGTCAEPGEIKVYAEADGVEPAQIVLHTAKVDNCEGVATQYINASQACDEIPIRKIEIISDGGMNLSADNRTVRLRAIIHPQNATCKELEWYAFNNAGIKSLIADVQPTEDGAILTAKGDGEFNVRCYCKNGRDKVSVFSKLDFKAEGLGTAFINPYEPVYAALHDVADAEFGNASCHAISSPGGRESYFGFTNMDFGSFGSDEVTVSLFSFSDKQDFRIEIWDNEPGSESAVLLGSEIYNRPCIWDVYQPLTIKLNRRINGIHTICVKFFEFINVLDVRFTKPQKGLSVIPVVMNDQIYGDEYTVTEEDIRDIGNNVSIEFADMDFGEGVSKITICGRSHIDTNTVHILFSGEDGIQSRSMVELKYSDDFVEKTFEIEKKQGIQRVTFVALPGSHFDFRWFQFS